MTKKRRKASISSGIGILLMLAGAALFFYPDAKDWYVERQAVKLSEEFREFSESNVPAPSETALADGDVDTETEESHLSSDSAETFISAANPSLLEGIREYNREIYENGQEDFKDAWSVTQTPVAVSGLEDGMFGYIEIPTMDCLLPLYIGASSEHMSKGAAVLGGTSIPIGGVSTNSVIAGHRGWKQSKYFKDIEEVSVGDHVYITNPWETLDYRVESIDIIDPDDSNKVKIQEGRDMITLITCHPYRSHGKYRYVLYCVRDGSTSPAVLPEGGGNVASANGEDIIIATDGNVYGLSGQDIWMETMVRRVCAVAILALVGITVCVKAKRKEF